MVERWVQEKNVWLNVSSTIEDPILWQRIFRVSIDLNRVFPFLFYREPPKLAVLAAKLTSADKSAAAPSLRARLNSPAWKSVAPWSSWAAPIMPSTSTIPSRMPSSFTMKSGTSLPPLMNENDRKSAFITQIALSESEWKHQSKYLNWDKRSREIASHPLYSSFDIQSLQQKRRKRIWTCKDSPSNSTQIDIIQTHILYIWQPMKCKEAQSS